MKKNKAQNIGRIDEPMINRKIVLLFLEKLELLTDGERKEILKSIQLLNYPVLIINKIDKPNEKEED